MNSSADFKDWFVLQNVLENGFSTRAWIMQELLKGNTLVNLTTSHGQAGWGLNSAWDIEIPGQGNAPTYHRTRTLTEAYSIVTTNKPLLRTKPFFRRFRDDRLMDETVGSAAANEPMVRAEVLGAGIPALSRATGANALGLNGITDINMQDLQTGWPESRTNKLYFGDNWLHSDLKNIAYPFNHKLHDSIVSKGNLKK